MACTFLAKSSNPSGHLQGPLGLDKLRSKLINEDHLAKDKADRIVDIFKNNAQKIRDPIIFQYIISTDSSIDELKDTLDRVWAKLSELAETLKRYGGTREGPPYG